MYIRSVNVLRVMTASAVVVILGFAASYGLLLIRSVSLANSGHSVGSMFTNFAWISIEGAFFCMIIVLAAGVFRSSGRGMMDGSI